VWEHHKFDIASGALSGFAFVAGMSLLFRADPCTLAHWNLPAPATDQVVDGGGQLTLEQVRYRVGCRSEPGTFLASVSNTGAVPIEVQQVDFIMRDETGRQVGATSSFPFLFSDQYLRGQIVYSGDRPAPLNIQVTFYTADGDLVGWEQDFLTEISPGATADFNITLFPNNFAGPAERYVFRYSLVR
jgi:hypothetical protein